VTTGQNIGQKEIARWETKPRGKESQGAMEKKGGRTFQKARINVAVEECGDG